MDSEIYDEIINEIEKKIIFQSDDSPYRNPYNVANSDGINEGLKIAITIVKELKEYKTKKRLDKLSEGL